MAGWHRPPVTAATRDSSATVKTLSSKQKSPGASSFGRIIIAAFLVGEASTLVIEGVYYARGESSLAVFLIDVLIFTTILTAISVTCYFLFRRILAQLERSQADLAAANLELAGYAHTVSHDLKGPITGVGLAFGAMDAVLRGRLDESARDTLREISEAGKRNTEHAARLVSDLLFIAETGAPKEVERVDLAAKLGEVAGVHEGRKGEGDFFMDADDDLGTVLASPVHVYELFENLLRNSIKHSGKADLVIQVRRLPAPSGVRVVFRDNGRGIDEDILPCVFDRFVKGAGGDTGLGLSIVDKIVRTYGGTISASNNGGASFEFTLKDFGGAEGAGRAPSEV
jgi:signal transduction histidine kinase